MQPGETLWSIAKAYKTTVEALRSGNKFLFSRPLQAGDTLMILPRASQPQLLPPIPAREHPPRSTHAYDSTARRSSLDNRGNSVYNAADAAAAHGGSERG